MRQECDVILDRWREQKAQVPDMLLFFRCGDFYETFGEDAQTLHDKAGTTLTVRRGLKLAGVPYHSVEAYIDRLVKAGIRVAVSEPMDPTQGLQSVWRVTRKVSDEVAA